MNEKVVVVPCSGIGKPYGEISRQAAYETIEDLRPGDTVTVCLGRLMIEDPEAVELVRAHRVITVDGCAKDCARKNVEAVGGKVEAAVKAIEAFKDHRDLKPEGVLNLGDAGFQLAHFLAEKLAGEVDCQLRGEDGQCWKG